MLLAIIKLLRSSVQRSLIRLSAPLQPRHGCKPPRSTGRNDHRHSPRKPEWLKGEIIRLKALMPQAGCRSIAGICNRRFAASRKITVGKIYAHQILQQHDYEIQILRRSLKHAKPKVAPRNLNWGISLTGKTDRTHFDTGAPRRNTNANWIRVNPSSLASGFYAATFQNTATGEIVIAYRGTNGPFDAVADVQLVAGQVPQQFNEAKAYYDAVAKQYGAGNVSVTGHSLGGAMASFVAASVGSATTATVFNAPGITNVVAGDPNSYTNVTNYNALFDPVSNLTPNQIGWINTVNGDGIATTAVTNGTHFDHDANGFAEATGWVNAQDGILVLDRNANGTIDSGRELFGSETLLANGQKAANGYVALAELDSNLDGQINNQDAAYTALNIWKDANGDGISQAGELLTLADAGVLSIATGSIAVNQLDANGNTIKQTGTFTKADGTTGNSADIWFNVNKTRTLATEWLPETAAVAALPDLQGFGNVYDLHQAMLRDGTGHLQGLAQQFASETNLAARQAANDSVFEMRRVG